MGILNVTIGSIDTTTAGVTDGYQDYSCTQKTVLSPGLTYPVSIRTNANGDENVRIWIDYNNDGQFDTATELFFSSNNARQHTGSSLPVPSSAVMGTPLRLRVAADAVVAPLPTPCSTPQYSQTEDYGVILAANTLPPAANFSVNISTACNGTFVFTDHSLRGATTWQWDFGDGTTSTQQHPSHTYSLPGSYPVRLRVCNANGCDSLTQTGTVAFYATNPVPAACTPRTLSYCCGFGITQTNLNGLLTTSANGSIGYENFACTRRITVTEAAPVPFQLTTGNAQQDFWLYVDLNNDGTFTSNELAYEALNSRNPTGFFIVPAGALLNQPLRLRLISDAAGSAGGPCTDQIRGQAEDYSIIVTPAACSTPVQAGQINYVAFTSSSGVIRSAMMVGRQSPNTYLQWQKSLNVQPRAWQNIAGANQPAYAAELSFSDASLFRALVSCGTASVATAEIQPKSGATNVALHPNTCGPAYIQAVTLDGTTLASSSGCAQADGPAYSFYDPTQPAYGAVVRKGDTYQLHVTTSANCRLTVFTTALSGNISLGGVTPQVVAATAGVPVSLLLPIDSTWATSGTVLLRLRCDQAASATQPADFAQPLPSGETEDYLLRVERWQCANPVLAGTITAPTQAQCGNAPVTLSIFGHSTGSRLQWQVSPDSLAWQDISGANSRTITVAVRQTGFYRVRLQGCSTILYTAPVKLIARPHTACYCTGPAGTATTALLTRLRIIGTTLNNSSAATAGPALSSYVPAIAQATATLVRGATYALEATVDAATASTLPTTVNAWLDLDHSGTYDSLEWVMLVRTITSPAGPTTYRAELPVASSALPGLTGLRIRATVGDAARPASACGNASGALTTGETEEYFVTIVAAPCTLPLSAGTIEVPSPLTCATVLRSRLHTLGARLQWQLSRTQGTTWIDIPAETTDALTLPFENRTAAVLYRLQVTCDGAAAYSAPVSIPAGNCGDFTCLNNLVGSGRTTTYLDNVAINGTSLGNYHSGRNAVPVTPVFSTTNVRWPQQVPNWTATLVRGTTYTLQTTAVGSSVSTGAWVDWNHDGTLSATEYYGIAMVEPGPVVTQSLALAVPATAALGTTLLRIRAIDSPALLPAYGCLPLNTQASETEDYLLTVTSQPGPALPALSVSPGAPCPGTPLTLTASGAGPGASYSWLGPNGFAATGASVTVASPTAAATFVALAERNGQRIATSLYVPLDCSIVTASTPTLARQERLSVFPNPTSTGECTVRLSTGSKLLSHAQVLVRTLAGQVVFSHLFAALPTASSFSDLPLDLRALPQGLYVVEVRTEHGSQFAKIVRE
jgi:PKD repeat protein